MKRRGYTTDVVDDVLNPKQIEYFPITQLHRNVYSEVCVIFSGNRPSPDQEPYRPPFNDLWADKDQTG